MKEDKDSNREETSLALEGIVVKGPPLCLREGSWKGQLGLVIWGGTS